MRRYIDNILENIDYGDVRVFDRLDALFPTFQSTPRYQPATLERCRGSIAWGAAVVARSYLAMYNTTHDERFLRKFVGSAEQMLLCRDSLVGLTDYRGRSGPVWSSGRPYTTNSIVIHENNGPGILEIRSKLADHFKITQNGSSFDLEFFDENDIGFGEIENLYLDPNSNRFIGKILSEFNWKKPLAAAKLTELFSDIDSLDSGTYKMKESFYVSAVETGQICSAFLEFCEIITSNKNLSVFNDHAERYLKASIEALAFHEEDICSDQSGNYIRIESDAPYDFESTDAPINHSMSIARCFILLFKITNRSKYRYLAEGFLKHFKTSLTDIGNDANKAYVWPYFSVTGVNFNGYEEKNRVSEWRTSRSGYPRMEDVSHAIISIEACIDAVDVGLVFDESDLRKFAYTFVNRVISKSDSLRSMHNYVDGTGGENKYLNAVGRWSILTRWNPEIWSICRSMMNESQPPLEHATVLYSAATLINQKQFT